MIVYGNHELISRREPNSHRLAPVHDPRFTRPRFGGGPRAPRAAREAVIALLEDRVAPQLAGAADLIVSAVDVELADDRLRIALMDEGGELSSASRRT